MIRFTWNGLNPWIIFKASLRQPIGFKSKITCFCFWLYIWSRNFERQDAAATKKKGQTMSNAQVTEVKKMIPLDEVVKTLPPQGSDEVQLTVTVQDLEDVEKKPTIH